MTNKILTAAVVLAAAFAAVQAQAACVDNLDIRGGIQVQTISEGPTGCTLSIDPTQTVGMVYRDYLFDETGIFMVFSSVDGSEATSAGARNYFFFPRLAMPSYQFLADGSLQINSATRQVFVFSGKTARIISIPGVSYVEDPAVSMNNNGGVNISKASGVWLDTGWETGSASFAHPEGVSTFHDVAGVSCQVTNSEIFTNDGNGNPVFNFPTDAKLAGFLKTRCPLLNTAALIAKPAALTISARELSAYSAALKARARR